MKKKIALFLLAATMSCNNGANNDAANAPKKDTAALTASPQNVMDSAATAKRFTEFMTPGPMQKLLATYAGIWSADMTFWMDENKPGEKSTLTVENNIILGGRYLQTVQSGSFEGKPFECIQMLGYDNLRKLFVFSQEDNMSTGIIYMEGQYDSVTDVITMKGQIDDPIKGKTELKSTFKLADANHLDIEWYGTPRNGTEMKFAEMKLTKK